MEILVLWNDVKVINILSKTTIYILLNENRSAVWRSWRVFNMVCSTLKQLKLLHTYFSRIQWGCCQGFRELSSTLQEVQSPNPGQSKKALALLHCVVWVWFRHAWSDFNQESMLAILYITLLPFQACSQQVVDLPQQVMEDLVVIKVWSDKITSCSLKFGLFF